MSFSTYFDPSSLFAGASDAIARTVTFKSGHGVLARGTVVGRITASDKYVPCVATADDGSQVPSAIVAADVDTTSADVAGPGYFHGEFAAEKLVIDASFTAATLEAALRANNIAIEVRSLGALG